MGKPQSNFQNRTIFGVPLIAGNTNISTIQFFEHYNERKSLLQENIVPHGSNRKRLHRKIESQERKGTKESRKSRHNGNGSG